MDDKRSKAIRNSEGLYASVFKAHGIELQKNEEIYYSTEKVPPLNSNICTKSPTWRPDDIFEAVTATAEKEGWESWSIKDSFACLPLEEKAFKKLFDAEWLYLPSTSFAPMENTLLSFERVHTAEGLLRWIEILGEEKTLYTYAMLNDPTLFFLIGHAQSGKSQAALLNRSDDVIGISNFFPQEKRAQKWSDLIRYIENTWGSIDVVGYEQSDVLDDIAELGVERVGDLRIWIMGL